MAVIDETQVRYWCELFHPNGTLTEIRVLGKKTYSGYFKSTDDIVAAIRNSYEGGIYAPMNEIDDACYGKEQKDKMVMSPKTTTNDNNIVGRNWLLIDLDPNRASDTNATDEEKGKAWQLMKTIGVFMQQQGMSSPIIADSGNGYHLYYRIKVSNTKEREDTIKNILQLLDMYFSNPDVSVDTSVFNAARIVKVIGTKSSKGADTPERPQRISCFVKVPTEIKVNDIAYLEKIAAMFPKREAPTRANNFNEHFDIDEFIEKNHIKIVRKSPFKNGERYVLEECPFDSSHKAPDAALFKMADGSIGFKCFHNSCANKTWRDFRLHFDPNAYDKKSYREFVSKMQYEQPITFKPMEETEEKGKKWQTMAEIPYVDPNSIITLPTGFIELDKAIRGLLVGDITVLSGLSGAGKSSWIDCVLLNLAERGVKAAIWSGELQSFRFQSWIDQIAAGSTYVDRMIGTNRAYYVSRLVADKIHAWLGDKILLYNNDYGCKWEQILNDISEVIEKGYKLIVLDNLAALDISGESYSKYEQQTKFITTVKEMAKKKNVHILVVAHPRKEMTFLRKESISGTADLTNLADNVLIIHRVNKDFEDRGRTFFGGKIDEYMKYDCVIEVAKNRMFGVVDYLVGMYYEQESRRLKNEIAEKIVYGWEEKPVQLAFDTRPLPPNPFANDMGHIYTEEELEQTTPF